MTQISHPTGGNFLLPHLGSGLRPRGCPGSFQNEMSSSSNSLPHTATTLERAYFHHPVKMQNSFKTCILTKFPLTFWKGEEDHSPVILTWIFYFHIGAVLTTQRHYKATRDPPSPIYADPCLSWLARITRYGEGRKILSIGWQLVLSSKKKNVTESRNCIFSNIIFQCARRLLPSGT